ncbi:MAG: amidohydrolase [Oscillospiraceae bacterium]|nr:amidohydrolase [Oscillospiraceae bacterium]
MDDKAPTAEAVATHGDEILLVGSLAACSELIGPDTKVVDLQGRTMLPGFYDPHSHITLYASFSDAVDLRPTNKRPLTSIAACQDVLKAALQSREGAGWLIGWNFDMTGFSEDPRPLNIRDLDAVSTAVPIVVFHQSMHSCMVNSKALARFGISADTDDPKGGRIGRFADGTPDGVLYGAAMHNALGHLDHILAHTPKAYAKATKWYASKGITTANDGATRTLDTVVEAVIGAEKEGLLATRLMLNPSVGHRGPLSVEEFVEKLKALKGRLAESSAFLRIGGAKLLFDGSIQLGTAYMSKPFHNNPENCGFTFMSYEDLLANIHTIHKAGYQVLTHCNGDAAITGVIDAYGAAFEAETTPDLRHTIVHAQTITADDLERVRDLAEVVVILSLFPPHIYYMGDSHADTFLGEERAARMNPAGSALKLGVPITIHDDAPIFDIDPLMTVWCAVNRLTKSGRVLGSDERISVWEALCGVTIGAAYSHFEEDIAGSIAAGKRADFVILDENPLTCDPLHIKDIGIVQTILGGRTTYQNNAMS